jgi:hypothetical protein
MELKGRHATDAPAHPERPRGRNRSRAGESVRVSMCTRQPASRYCTGAGRAGAASSAGWLTVGQREKLFQLPPPARALRVAHTRTVAPVSGETDEHPHNVPHGRDQLGREEGKGADILQQAGSR